jgi:hypothetical protein
MAKIDTNKIEGFSEMTAEEQIAALLAYEVENDTSEIENYKKMLNKASSEAADWKRKHNALLSEEEKAKAEAEEERQRKADEFAEMQKRLNDLETEKTVALYQTKLVSMGYNADLASATAKALSEGKMNEVFANMAQHLDAKEKILRTEILKGTPTPDVGGSGSISMTKEDIYKKDEYGRYVLSASERQKALAEMNSN